MPNSDERIIPVDQIVKAPRGRKAEIDQDLLNLLKAVKPGFAANLETIFGSVDKADRSRISQKVRIHWGMVHNSKPSLNYSPQGILQVTHASR